MSLVLHIFRKDARHLYPEILVTLVLTAAFAWSAPMQWIFPGVRGQAAVGATAGSIVYLLAPLLRIQLPIAWLVLISRLIHDESLVGDRQFWITRPYTWTTLLASKLLFLAAFLYLPFVLMQLYLLHHAGLDVTAALPDLLRYNLRLTALLILPFVTVAAVTATFARLALSLLIAVAYVTGLFAAGATLLQSRMVPPHLYLVCSILFAGALAALLVLQYANRRTVIHRVALVCVPLALALLTLIVPSTALIHRAYRNAPQAAPPTLTVDSDPLRQEPGSGPPLYLENKILVTLPLQQSGGPTGVRYKIDGVATSISGPQGFQWTSPFLSGGASELGQAVTSPIVGIFLPAPVFERIRNTPVDLHLELAVTAYGTSAPETVPASAPSFRAPGRGLCLDSPEGYTVNCRYAFRLPAPTDVSAQVSTQICGLETSPHAAPAADAPEQAVSRHGIGADDDHLALDFDPVTTSYSTFTWPYQNANGAPGKRAFLCPGTPVTFTPHPLLGRTELSLDAHGLILTPYGRRQRSAPGKELRRE